MSGFDPVGLGANPSEAAKFRPVVITIREANVSFGETE
jgi:hypothetical protein